MFLYIKLYFVNFVFMKIISTYLNYENEKRDLIIYENWDEFKASGLPLYSLLKVERLCYTKSDDGFYIPLLDKSCLTTYQGNLFYVFKFPMGVTFHNVYYVSDFEGKSRWRKKVFRWSVNFEKINKHKNNTYLSPNERIAAGLIANNVDVYDAFKLAYPNANKENLNKAMLKTLDKNYFHQIITEKFDMDTIKDALNNLNASEEAAKSIIELMGAKKADDTIDLPSRKFGISAYINIDRAYSEVSNKSDNVDYINIEKELESKYLNQ